MISIPIAGASTLITRLFVLSYLCISVPCNQLESLRRRLITLLMLWE